MTWSVILQDVVFAVSVPATRSLVTLLGIVTVIVLLGLSAFFSSSEIAMFSFPRHRVDALVERGVPGATTVAALRADPHRLLITILVWNNVVNIAMSSIATGVLALHVSQGEAVFLATFGVTTLVLLFGESAPKSYAVEHAESWGLRIARPLQVAERALYPMIVCFDHLTRVVNRLTGGRSSAEAETLSRQEVREVIETGERQGVLDTAEYEMLRRSFQFSATIAKEVMTPRLDITAVDADADPADALRTCVESDHARFPVYRGTLDNVVGAVAIETLVARQDDFADLTVTELCEPALFVPESKSVDNLLTEMKSERIQMAVVVDEFGTTAGIVTMEDIVAQIVGELLVNRDTEAVEVVDEASALVSGETPIETVNDALDIDLPEGEEFETLAGYLFNRVGRLVEQGEQFTDDDLHFEVVRTDGTRIKTVRISVASPGEPDTASFGTPG